MSAAHVARTRRSVWFRIERRLMIWWLRFEISSAEQWIADCAREGITTGEGLNRLRREVSLLYVQLAQWEAA